MAKRSSAKLDAELFGAIAKGETARVRELLGKGANPNATDAHGQTPAMVAAWEGKSEIFALLEKAGADLNARIGSASVLWKAGICFHNDEAAALTMLKRVVARVDLSEYKEALSLLLSWGSETRSPDYLHELMLLGADPTYVDEDGEGALLMAVWENRPTVVKELLAGGADPNVLVPKKIGEFSHFEKVPRSLRGRPIIELALGKRLTEIANLLKAAGAKGSVPVSAPAIKQSDDIDVSWKRIEDWIRTHAKTWKPLTKGATDKQIERAAAELGIAFPNDLKASMRRHNGSDDLIPGEGCHYFLMPLAELIADTKMMNEMADDGDFDESKAKPDKGVRKAWWHRGWLPFASNGGGDYYCLDLDPAKGGTAGQVISFFHESGERVLMSPSLRKWLFDFANELEAGGLKYDTLEGLVG